MPRYVIEYNGLDYIVYCGACDGVVAEARETRDGMLAWPANATCVKGCHGGRASSSHAEERYHALDAGDYRRDILESQL